MSEGQSHSGIVTTEALLARWRERTSRRLLTFMAAGAVILTLAFAGTLGLTAIAGSFVISALLVAVATWKRAPQGLRSGVSLFVFAYTGSFSLIMGHDPTAGMLLYMVGVVFAVLFVGWRAAAVFTAAMAGMLGLAALLDARGVSLTPESMTVLEPAAMLVSNAVLLGVGGAIVVASLTQLVESLREAQVRQAEAIARVERESAEREQALVRLEQAHGRLEQAQAQLISAGKMELLNQLAGGIAHDMNNALTVVLGEAGLLYEDQPEAAEAISEAVEHASSLTRQLLAMGRGGVVQAQALDLAEVVERGAAMLRRAVPSDLSIALELEPAIGVRADPNQIQQIVLNLGSNAAHAMAGSPGASRGGGQLRLRVSGDSSWARLEVVDTGEGMDAKTLARIFEPFFSTKAPGRGTGLGLSSTRAVVESLGGRIDCRSEPGEGTQFTVELPRLDPGSFEALGAQSRAEASGERIRLDGARVLVVDDELRVRATVASTLEAAGAVVTDAGHTRSAIVLASAAERPFDLLWTDVVMSHGGGGALIQWFAEHSPSTRVVVCTGYSDDVLVDREVALGRHRLVHKPFRRAEVLEACAAALDSGQPSATAN